MVPTVGLTSSCLRFCLVPLAKQGHVASWPKADWEK